MSRNSIIAVPVILLSAVVALISSHPLIDPDLGWNLAGGLFILDNRTIPKVDPFAAFSVEWIDYCFLPQILFGLVYRSLGFRGLLSLQSLVPVAVSLSAFLFFFKERELNQFDLKRALVPVMLSAGLILFIAPIFHLRPQLFSVWLFLLFLIWRSGKQQNLILLSCLLVFWNNTHVYWIFGPVILTFDFLIARFFASSKKISIAPVLISLVAPVVSPYGVRNYLPIIEYAFFHSHVKKMIQEFQPLLFTEGYLLPYTCLVMVLLIYFAKREEISKKNILLSGMFFALTLWQMKFTPLFGVFSIITLSSLKTVETGRLKISSCVPAFSISLVVSFLYSLFILPVVGDNQAELLKCAKFLSASPEIFMSQFNSGGWLELGIYLNDKNSTAKPIIDGRTLVMGETRLKDYFFVSTKQSQFVDYLERYHVEVFILNRQSPLTEIALNPMTNAKIEFETPNYLVFKRSLISINNS